MTTLFVVGMLLARPTPLAAPIGAPPLPAVAAPPAPAAAAHPAPAVAGPVAPQAGTPFSTSLGDDALTRAAAPSFPQTMSGVTVSDPVVHVTAGGVRLTATARVLFGVTQFVMDATPYVADGRVAVRVDSATLGGFSLPDSTRRSISASVQSAIGQLVSAKMQVTSVTLGNGALTVKGLSH